LCAFLPPKSLPVLIRQQNGRILAGIVVEVDRKKGQVRLSHVILLSVVGLKSKLDPIYEKSGKIKGILEIPIESIALWEKLPAYIKLED